MNFIIRRDPSKKFHFTALQSTFAQEIVRKYKLSDDCFETIILIKNEKVYLRSDAVLQIANELSHHWYLLKIFKVVPHFLRDSLYRYISKNRYNFFGKKSSCMIPSKDIEERFID